RSALEAARTDLENAGSIDALEFVMGEGVSVSVTLAEQP
ncbi:MAG: hypothetical protein RLZZ88_1179, partial [Actinomycetota bacterium]